MARSQKDMQEEIERNKERIETLEKELRESRSNEKGLEDKVKSLEKEIQDLKDKNEDLFKKLQEMKGEIKELKNENEVQKGKIEKLEKEYEDQKKQKQHDDYVLILVQIGFDIQRNMCRYVLGKFFKKRRYYKFKEIENYIGRDIKQPDDKYSAKKRLRELKTKISWDPDLVDSLKNLNQTRIGIAHPELTSEMIQEATKFLSEMGKLDEEEVEDINILKDQWETSKALLQTSSAGGPGQKHRTDANKVVNGFLRY